MSVFADLWGKAIAAHVEPGAGSLFAVCFAGLSVGLFANVVARHATRRPAGERSRRNATSAKQLGCDGASNAMSHKAAPKWRLAIQWRRPARRASFGRVAARMARTFALVLQTRAPGVLSRVGRRDARELIARAGMSGAIGTRDVAAARLFCIAAAVALTPRLTDHLPLRAWPLVLPLWLAGGAELPLWWLRRAAVRRQRAVRESLPDALELLCAALAAGLPLRRALLLVGDHCAEPLAGELICVSGETSLGVPLVVALDGLVARNQLPEIRALVAAIRQAERHGSPLAPVVAAQAADARAAHNREIVERGARAAPKIQLIVATTIVPAAMIGFAAIVIAAIARGDLNFL